MRVGKSTKYENGNDLDTIFRNTPKTISDLTFCKINYLKCSISQNSTLIEFSKNKNDELSFLITELGILKITVYKFVTIIGSGTKQILVE